MKTQNRKADFAANQLIDEKSPYLLQHAYNPVKWHPWEDEVFLEARRKDVPVFLSIGYSTCHWCHVMAEESFEDPEVILAGRSLSGTGRNRRPSVLQPV